MTLNFAFPRATCCDTCAMRGGNENLLRLVATGYLLTTATGARAGDGPDPQTIIVTGERVSRTALATQSSVVVTSRDEIDLAPDVERLDELLDATPNVVLGSGGTGPTIRGQDTTGVLRDLPAFLGGNRPRTTVVIDGRAVSYNEFVFGAQPLWDVERVEIFRSPQTTTQGRNSIAGAIFIETRDPAFEWSGRIRGLLAESETSQASVVLNGPIMAENLAMRISADRRRSRASTEMTGGAEGVDQSRKFYDLVRLKLLATPKSAPGLRIEGSYYWTRSQASQIEGMEAPFEKRRDTRAVYGVFRNEVQALTLRAQTELAPGLSSSTTLSFGKADISRFAPAGLGEADNNVRDRSVETTIRLARGALDLVAGASYSRARLRQRIDLTRVGLGIGTFADQQTSEAVFGQADLTLARGVTLTLGARAQRDVQERQGILAKPLGPQPLDFRRRDGFFAPKFAIAYDILPDITAGLFVQKAANAGGATLIPTSGVIDAFDREYLWSYEGFVKGRLPQFDLGFAAQFFRYDITDGQRSIMQPVITPGGTFYLLQIGNVPRSWSEGAELELSWTPSAKFDLKAALGLLDTRITEVPSDRDPLLGKQFQRSPHVSASVSVGWRPLASLRIGASFRTRSGYYSDDANTPTKWVGSASLLDLRAQWECGDFRAFAYVTNALDGFYLTSQFPDRQLATAYDPRQFGAGIELVF